MSDAMRDPIFTATLKLAADRSILSVSLADIAAAAGVTLAELRARYDSRMDILEDFSRSIDEKVLASSEIEAAGEPAKDRLFAVLMARFDALAPYREGLRGLQATARRDPIFAACLNRIALKSQRWMLAAASLEPTGPFAAIRLLGRAQALVLVVTRVMPVFLDDAEAGLPKTMAELDRELERLDRAAQVITRLEGTCERIFRGKSPAAAEPPPVADPAQGEAAAA